MAVQNKSQRIVRFAGVEAFSNSRPIVPGKRLDPKVLALGDFVFDV